MTMYFNYKKISDRLGLLFIGLMVLLSTFSCSSNKFKKDLSTINIQIDFKHFEKELFTINPDSIYQHIPRLIENYDVFFELYTQHVIGIGKPESADFIFNLKKFVTYCEDNNLIQMVSNTFPNTDSIEISLKEAMRYYKYYFPKKNIPTVYFCLTGLNISVFTADSIMGISLERYLGAETKIYKEMGIENYLRMNMNKHRITTDCMKALAEAEFPYDDTSDKLLSVMIYNGKIQYFLDAMLPETPDSIKWGYTARQSKWVKKYESKIWDYLVEQKLLFVNDKMQIQVFTGEAPFTTPFRNISAPRCGNWIGYRIVNAYMDNNPDVTIEQLMQNENFMEIYNLSKYKP